MSYTDHFQMTDDLIVHLDAVVAGHRDPLVQSKYSGFLAVSAVTALELALKAILIDFAHRKHKLLGTFCEHYLERINGRIGLNSIKEEYVTKFGAKYLNRFTRQLERLEKRSLKEGRGSPKSQYGNLITWRNAYVHQGNMHAQATYGEVKRAFQDGKRIMECLASCLRR